MTFSLTFLSLYMFFSGALFIISFVEYLKEGTWRTYLFLAFLSLVLGSIKFHNLLP